MTEISYTEPLKHIARKAGEIIMGHYAGEIDVEIKEDNSPVTIADQQTNDYIVAELTKLTPHIPIVSEEGDQDSGIRNQESAFWLVDPLDGTKSFIKRTGEFTVNIGLIEQGVPTQGVVYVPVQDIMYYTDGGKAYKESGIQNSAFSKEEGRLANRPSPEPERTHLCGSEESSAKVSKPSQGHQIHVRQPDEAGLTVVASLSHRTPETDAFIATLKVKDIISVSSSLKFCVVAEGKADIYPRFGRTMEWDTAAGDAVLRAAGGSVTLTDGAPFTYGKPIFENPYFIARGKW